jgi:hypothetical protein
MIVGGGVAVADGETILAVPVMTGAGVGGAGVFSSREQAASSKKNSKKPFHLFTALIVRQAKEKVKKGYGNAKPFYYPLP